MRQGEKGKKDWQVVLISLTRLTCSFVLPVLMHLVQASCLAHDGSESLEAVERAAVLAVQAQRIWESSKDAERSCNFKTGSSGVDFSPMMMICYLVDARGGRDAFGTEKALERVVEIMLETVKDVNHKSTMDGDRPLIKASRSGHLAVVELLLKQEKIDVNQAEEDGATPLYMASQEGHSAVVELLLKQEKIDVNQADNDGFTPLSFASQNGQLAVVELLLKHKKINVNQAANNGATPLLVASAKGNVEIVKILLSKGADATLTAAFGRTPLQIAEERNKSEVAEVLRAHERNAVSPVDHLK